MTKNIALLLCGTMILAGCGDNSSPVSEEERAKDVAMVERMSRLPVKPIEPQEIPQTEIVRNGLDRSSCAFRKAENSGVLFLAGKDEGFFHLNGELQHLSAKGGSATLTGGARSSYIGLAHWIDFMRLPDADTGGDRVHWPARMVIRDGQERIVYQLDGLMNCHSS